MSKSRWWWLFSGATHSKYFSLFKGGNFWFSSAIKEKKKVSNKYLVSLLEILLWEIWTAIHYVIDIKYSVLYIFTLNMSLMMIIHTKKIMKIGQYIMSKDDIKISKWIILIKISRLLVIGYASCGDLYTLELIDPII